LRVIVAEDDGAEDEGGLEGGLLDEVFSTDKRLDKVEFRDENATNCEGEEEERYYQPANLLIISYEARIAAGSRRNANSQMVFATRASLQSPQDHPIPAL